MKHFSFPFCEHKNYKLNLKQYFNTKSNSFPIPRSREKRHLQLSFKIVQNRSHNVPYVLSQGQVVGMKHSTSVAFIKTKAGAICLTCCLTSTFTFRPNFSIRIIIFCVTVTMPLITVKCGSLLYTDIQQLLIQPHLSAPWPQLFASWWPNIWPRSCWCLWWPDILLCPNMSSKNVSELNFRIVHHIILIGPQTCLHWVSVQTKTMSLNV